MSWTKKIAARMPEPSSRQQLRSFGLIVGGVFLALALWPVVVRGQDPRTWALVLGGLFGLPALIYAPSLRHPYRIWMLIGFCLGWVNTRIILTILFYALFTPVSAFMRLIKRDAMGRTFDPSLETYRVVKKPRTVSDLKHQF